MVGPLGEDAEGRGGVLEEQVFGEGVEKQVVGAYARGDK